MTKQNGFTLVELAIALMVIGLLIGGVLKGQELIENARVTATIRNLKAYDAAVMVFRNTYNAWPGDIRRPERIPNCTATPCSTPGNGNGSYFGGSDPAVEPFNFFPHLTKAGMIQGPMGGTDAEMAAVDPLAYNEEASKFYPEMPIGPLHTPQTNSSGRMNTFFYLSTRVKPAIQLDEKMDDGKPLLGGIVIESCATIDGGGGPSTVVYDTNDSGTCDLFVDLNM